MIGVAPASRPTAVTFGPDRTVPLPTLLHTLCEAYAAGDSPLGELLLLEALDEQLPWDMVCAAAARGIAAHRAEQSRA